MGKGAIVLMTRKAGAHAHKLTKRRKTRDKARAVRERIRED